MDIDYVSAERAESAEKNRDHKITPNENIGFGCLISHLLFVAPDEL